MKNYTQEDAFTSEPMKIGKHEWTVSIIRHWNHGALQEYRFRKIPSPDFPADRNPWQTMEHFPTYDHNNGQTAGCPKTIKKLWEQNKPALDAAKAQINAILKIEGWVNSGKSVRWSNSLYIVTKDAAGIYNIVCTSNGSTIGLSNKAGTHLNGKAEDFYTIDTELTDVGEQFVISGCEQQTTEQNPQGKLF